MGPLTGGLSLTSERAQLVVHLGPRSRHVGRAGEATSRQAHVAGGTGRGAHVEPGFRLRAIDPTGAIHMADSDAVAAAISRADAEYVARVLLGGPAGSRPLDAGQARRVLGRRALLLLEDLNAAACSLCAGHFVGGQGLLAGCGAGRGDRSPQAGEQADEKTNPDTFHVRTPFE